MIYAIGIDKDPGFIHFVRETVRQGVRVTPINIKSVVHNGAWKIGVPADDDSFVVTETGTIPLRPNGAYYCRIYDLASKQTHTRDRDRWLNFISGISAWLEVAPGVVVNRPNAAIDNFVKPLHEFHLSEHGLHVPESLTSSCRADIKAFCDAGPTIVKSVSGARSDAMQLTAEMLTNYDASQGPLHLQRLVRGFDIRAHVVGTAIHAEKILSDAVDYRAVREGLKFEPYKLPAFLETQLVQATQAFGLSLAGWDFKVDAEGVHWCLEANSLPGYFNYDKRCNGAITASLLDLLQGTPRAA